MTKHSVTITVERAGLLTLIQDGGRSGYAAFGLPRGGAMDRRAARTANWLVGQDAGTPVLEITLRGPALRFDKAVQIALAGAEVDAQLDGKPFPAYETVSVRPGQCLDIGQVQRGCRVYLAIRGQWRAPRWLDSYSAFLLDGSYSPAGSRLQKGNRLVVETSRVVENRSIALRERPFLSHEITVRVLPGPEYDWFSAHQIHFFTTHRLTIHPDSNRMGYRLRESLPDYRAERELISSGIVPGTVQVLPSGAPVILLADAQTTGGYPRIANILDRDLDDLAQLRPGNGVRFALVDSLSSSE